MKEFEREEHHWHPNGVSLSIEEKKQWIHLCLTTTYNSEKNYNGKLLENHCSILERSISKNLTYKGTGFLYITK